MVVTCPSHRDRTSSNRQQRREIEKNSYKQNRSDVVLRRLERETPNTLTIKVAHHSYQETLNDARKPQVKARRSRNSLRRRNWSRVADWSHARVEPRPQSRATDSFRGKSVCRMKCSAWLLFALLPRLFAVLPVANCQIVGQRIPVRQGLGREQPIVRISGQGSVAGKEVRHDFIVI